MLHGSELALFKATLTGSSAKNIQVRYYVSCSSFAVETPAASLRCHLSAALGPKGNEKGSGQFEARAGEKRKRGRAKKSFG